jgi:hypothetical protein
MLTPEQNDAIFGSSIRVFRLTPIEEGSRRSLGGESGVVSSGVRERRAGASPKGTACAGPQRSLEGRSREIFKVMSVATESLTL